jgi:hypothetical protein
LGAVAKIGLKEEDKQESSSNEGSSDDESDYDVSGTFIFLPLIPFYCKINHCIFIWFFDEMPWWH